MADFYPILARAVAGLPETSPAARQAIYERARAALVAQLRSLDPPLGEAEIMRERLSLDEAVARIEADYDDAPPPFDSESLPPPMMPEALAPEPLPPLAAPPPAPRFEPAPAPLPEDDRFDEPRRDVTEPQPVRPRLSPPREKRVKPVHLRTAVVATGVAIAVAAIAAAAYYVNKVNPPDLAARPRVESPAQPAQADNAGKINERAGEPGTQAPVSRPSGGGASTSVPSQEIAVAQRAILYIEDPASPQTPRAVNGRVFWRLDSESVGQGRPVETIVRATVEVAEMGLSLDFTIRRNTDTAFPASHIIGMRFTSTGDPATESVREVGVPQFKTEESERGAPLSAINSALGENLFVAALSNVPVEVERNIELILNRAWIDVPVRFASGKRGILTFEKGVSGGQTLADAFGRWR